MFFRSNHQINVTKNEVLPLYLGVKLICVTKYKVCDTTEIV